MYDVPPGGQPPTSTAHGPVALDSDGGAHRSEKIRGRGFETLVARSLDELFFPNVNYFTQLSQFLSFCAECGWMGRLTGRWGPSAGAGDARSHENAYRGGCGLDR